MKGNMKDIISKNKNNQMFYINKWLNENKLKLTSKEYDKIIKCYIVDMTLTGDLYDDLLKETFINGQGIYEYLNNIKYDLGSAKAVLKELL